jgi:AmmeMemoRadiSam system protein A
LEQQHALMDAARGVIRRALRKEPAGAAPCPHPSLLQPAGCFVSLHTLAGRRLRGCVGRLEADGPLWNVVCATAHNVLRDPRFGQYPVCIDELSLLDLELSILSSLSPAAHPLDFDPQKHGIHLMCASRSGCFLPQVARETGWTREQLLARLCSEKMALPPTFWMQAGAILQTFTTLIVGPEPFEM